MRNYLSAALDAASDKLVDRVVVEITEHDRVTDVDLALLDLSVWLRRFAHWSRPGEWIHR